MKTEGWLILTENALNWYDKDPGVGNNMPVHSCTFNSPEETFHLQSSVDKGNLPPTKQAVLAFGVEKHRSGTREEIVFIAKDIQSKNEWLKAIRSVLDSHSITQEMDTAKRIDHTSPTTTAKELRSVSIVPVRISSQKSAIDIDGSFTPTSPYQRSKQKDLSASQDVDLSIRSSMFGSPSDTSFI